MKLPQITPAKIFLSLLGLVVLIWLITWITNSCQTEKGKQPALPTFKQDPVKPQPVDSVKASKKAETAQGKVNDLEQKHPLPRRPLQLTKRPDLPTTATPIQLLERKVDVLTEQVILLTAQLNSSDTVLAATRANYKVIIADKDRQIAELKQQLKQQTADYEQQRKQDRVTVEAYAKAQRKVREMLTEEALTDRFLGVGRKSAVKRIIVQLPAVPDPQ